MSLAPALCGPSEGIVLPPYSVETDWELGVVPRLIEHVSMYARLGAGALLLTSSPAANGASWGRFLRPGDVAESEIEGLGKQRNHCVASGAEPVGGAP